MKKLYPTTCWFAPRVVWVYEKRKQRVSVVITSFKNTEHFPGISSLHNFTGSNLGTTGIFPFSNVEKSRWDILIGKSLTTKFQSNLLFFVLKDKPAETTAHPGFPIPRVSPLSPFSLAIVLSFVFFVKSAVRAVYRCLRAAAGSPWLLMAISFSRYSCHLTRSFSLQKVFVRSC